MQRGIRGFKGRNSICARYSLQELLLGCNLLSFGVCEGFKLVCLALKMLSRGFLAVLLIGRIGRFQPGKRNPEIRN